jgi:hypothetical protein
MWPVFAYRFGVPHNSDFVLGCSLFQFRTAKVNSIWCSAVKRLMRPFAAVIAVRGERTIGFAHGAWKEKTWIEDVKRRRVKTGRREDVCEIERRGQKRCEIERRGEKTWTPTI